ncbi:putative PKS-like enzyme [Corchorus olitorius]|uniref:PKS-like enzyme n=1 Tax=Corchorus olitorius TaxID=93759 RepID=A0A1R3GX28_9ROSI|nr:putative PKS-like enzyme [Corchorus olitorius]
MAKKNKEKYIEKLEPTSIKKEGEDRYFFSFSPFISLRPNLTTSITHYRNNDHKENPNSYPRISENSPGPYNQATKQIQQIQSSETKNKAILSPDGFTLNMHASDPIFGNHNPKLMTTHP